MNKNIFKKSHKKWFLTKIIKAVKTYDLFENDNKICVGLSGGKDSTTLLFLLDYLRNFSNFDFELYGIHVNAFSKMESSRLKKFCEECNATYLEVDLEFDKEFDKKSVCYICSKLKRGAMSKKMKEFSINKIAFGHHGTDVAVTFLMNIFQNKKLGSFSPKVGIPESEIKIIRPLIYLNKSTIEAIHKKFNLPVFKDFCEFEKDNLRLDYEKMLENLRKDFLEKDIEQFFVHSLENIDKSNIWENITQLK